MRTILVATDFSPCARTAIQLASALARRLDAQLHLVHVFQPAPLDLAAMPSGTGWELEMMADAEKKIVHEASDLRRTGIAVSGEVQMGLPASLIVATAHAVGASLIVVGTHGRTGIVNLYLGSIAERVCRTATCPVLVTPQDIAGTGHWDAPNRLHLALVSDGTSAAKASASWIRGAAQTIAGELSLFRIYWPPEEAARYGLDEPWQGRDGHPDLVQLLERDLRRDTQALDSARPPSIRFRIADREAAARLDSDARALGADALVVGVGKQGDRRWAAVGLASLLKATSLPVFCIPQAIVPEQRHLPLFRSVLLACDLSDNSKAAVLPAYGLLAGGGLVQLCYVHESALVTPGSSTPLTQPLSPDERSSIEARLRALVPAEAAEHGIATHVSIAEGHNASEALLAAAERLDVDVIALGSHGRSGLRRALLGSVAEQVARHSPRPVFIARKPAQ
ncbi:MAG: hypothetical protein QOI66_1719 [Myxococcales bacterium]|jgi:nucleotide-binding universal stress UspA family protein|nr:hypothetical protein [Myxococcales bacterium]